MHLLESAVDSVADHFWDLSTKVVIESHDAKFFENLFLKDKCITLQGQVITVSNSHEELEQDNTASNHGMTSQPKIRVSSIVGIPN